MTQILNSWRIREIIEDRLEAATGEPRHVTDIEVDFIPEQDDAHNWSVHAKCKPQFGAALDQVLDQVQAEFPVIDF